MAGGDPLGMYAESPDFGRPSMGSSLDRLWSEYQQFKKRKKYRLQAEQDVTLLDSPDVAVDYQPSEPSEKGKFKRMYSTELSDAEIKRRKAEASTDAGELMTRIGAQELALQEKQANIKTWDQAFAFFDDAEKVANNRAELYDRIRKQTVDDYKAGKMSPQQFNERVTMLLGEQGEDGTRSGGLRHDIEAMRRSLADARAATEQKQQEAMTAAEYEAAKAAGDRSGLMKVIDPINSARVLEWSPVKWTINKLAGPVEVLGGYAGTALENLNLAEFKTNVSGNEVLGADTATGAPSPMGTGWNEDSPLRKRGREFWAQAGDNLALWHEQHPLASQVTNPAAGPMNLVDVLEGYDLVKPRDAHDYRAAAGDMTLQVMSDPLNVVDVGPGITKQLGKLEKVALESETFLKFAAKHPKIAYAPSKFIRYATGHAKEAMVLGDKQLEGVYQAERNFTREAGYEYAQLSHDALAAEAATAKRLPDEAARQRLKIDLPGVVEKGKDWRMAQRAILEDPYSQVLFDAADTYDDLAARAYVLDQKYSRQYAKLGGEYSYFGRQFSDELAAHLAENPTAQAELFGQQFKGSRDSLVSALQDYEKGRKLRDFDFLESEAILRDAFRKKGINIPDDMPIWSREAFSDLAKRANKAKAVAEQRNLWLNFAQEFNINPQADDMVEQVQKAWAGLERKAPVAAPTGGETLRAEAETAGQQYGKASTEAQDATARADAARNRMRAASANLEEARKARSQAKADYFAGQEGLNAGRAGANESMQDATKRLLEAEDALKRAKASAVDPEEVARLEREAEAARQAAEAARGKAANAEQAAKEYEQAYAEWHKAAVEGQAANPENWSAHSKAAWVQGQVTPGMGRVSAAGTRRPMSALDVLLMAKAQLPDDVGELARLASTVVTRDDAAKFTKYLENFHYQHLDKPGKILAGYDRVKRFYQRATLARLGSVTKDNIGNMMQSVISGNTFHLNDARKALGGNPITWAKGIGSGFEAAPDVIRLANEGVLETRVSEALQRNKPAGLIGKLETRGVVGSVIPGAEKVTDALMHERVWVEQVNRLATYRKAIADGMSHAEAVEEVYKYWGKFDELTKLERGVLSRIFFFWTWMQRSMPITVRMLLDHPVRMRMMLTMMAGDSINPDAERNMPEWMRRMGGWILGKDKAGNVDVVSPGSSTYASPLFSFLQGDMVKAMSSGHAEEAPGLALREVMRASPPFVQAAGELAQQRDYFTDQDWWKDRDPNKGSNMKAPSFVYWLTNRGQGEETAIQKALGATVETDRDTGEFKRVTMNPYWAWLLDALPGVSSVAGDVSSFAHPGQGDVGDLSIKNGLARQAGVPIYHVPAPKDIQSDAFTLRESLAKSASQLTNKTLVYGDYGIQPNEKTMAGRQFKADRDKWRQEAKEQKLPRNVAEQYVSDRIRAHYLQEWRVLELEKRLEVIWKLARDEKVAREPGSLEVKLPDFDKRLTRQATREKKRRLNELELRLK